MSSKLQQRKKISTDEFIEKELLNSWATEFNIRRKGLPLKMYWKSMRAKAAKRIDLRKGKKKTPSQDQVRFITPF